MDITIIGTGNMARSIAIRALAGGHTVTLHGTDATKASELAAELSGDVRTGTAADPLDGDVVVLAIPYTAIDDVIGAYGDQLSGEVVVDITNPVDFSSFTPLTVEAGSAAAEIAQKAPGARVVKAFNTTFAGPLAAGQVDSQPLDVFLASDDEEAKRTVGQLVEDGGLRAIDAGPLARAHELEALGYLHMALQQPLGTSFASTVKVLAQKGAQRAVKEVFDPGWEWDKPWGYSQAVRVGETVLVSGQTPLDSHGNLLHEGDIRGQTRQVFENLKTVLAAAELSLDQVVEIVSYHTNMSDIAAMNEVKAEYLTENLPAWTAVGVTSLAFPGQLLEIKAMAVAS